MAKSFLTDMRRIWKEFWHAIPKGRNLIPKKEEAIVLGAYVALTLVMYAAAGVLLVGNLISLNALSIILTLGGFLFAGCAVYVHMRLRDKRNKQGPMRLVLGMAFIQSLLQLKFGNVGMFVYSVATIPHVLLGYMLFFGGLYALVTHRRWRHAVYGVLMLVVSLSIVTFIEVLVMVPVLGLETVSVLWHTQILGGAIFASIRSQLLQFIFTGFFAGMPVLVYASLHKKKSILHLSLAIGSALSLALIFASMIYALVNIGTPYFVDMMFTVVGKMQFFGFQPLVLFAIFGALSYLALERQKLI